MLNHTKNPTTITIGQSTATCILATKGYKGHDIYTMELVYPRYIHSELMTHRMFSRNASSSRATPITVNISEVQNDPVFFDYVGRNQSGMVAGKPLDLVNLELFKKEWNDLGYWVAARVKDMSDKYHIHKQTLNRALEPWSRIRTLVTATEWDNFFSLRLAEGAQPEIRSLAQAILESMQLAELKQRTFHVPYVDEITEQDFKETTMLYTRNNNKLSVLDKFLISAARCARVSYGRLDARPINNEEDIKLAMRLYENGHMSPFEHVIKVEGADMMFYNLVGAYSLRYALEQY